MTELTVSNLQLGAFFRRKLMIMQWNQKPTSIFWGSKWWGSTAKRKLERLQFSTSSSFEVPVDVNLKHIFELFGL